MLRLGQVPKVNKLKGILGANPQKYCSTKAATVNEVKLPTEADVVIIGNSCLSCVCVCVSLKFK